MFLLAGQWESTNICNTVVAFLTDSCYILIYMKHCLVKIDVGYADYINSFENVENQYWLIENVYAVLNWLAVYDIKALRQGLEHRLNGWYDARRITLND